MGLVDGGGIIAACLNQQSWDLDEDLLGRLNCTCLPTYPDDDDVDACHLHFVFVFEWKMMTQLQLQFRVNRKRHLPTYL